MVRNTPEVKQLNTESIRREIQNSSTCTKAEISRLTGLSVATCSTILNEMLKTGEIIQVDQETPNVGRPASIFCYNTDYQHVLGMYIAVEEGIYTIAYAVADGLGKICDEHQIHPKEITYELIEAMVAQAIEKDSHIQAITFGIPGISHHGVIERCDIQSVVGIDIEGNLNRKFNISAEVRNDMDFISTGVYASVNHNGGSFATMYFPQTLDGCVGCGFVIDGKVLRGASKFVGEISYIAEGFGISRKEQANIIIGQDKLTFRKLAAKLVLSVICTIDPEAIMIIGNSIIEDDLPAIREECERVVSKNHIPRFLVDTDIHKNYSIGLIRAALDSLQFPISK